MKLVRQPSLPRGAALLLIAAWVFWKGEREYLQAHRAYQGAPAQPVAEYVVEGRRWLEVGSGKGRHSEYFLQLGLDGAQPAVPAATELRVGAKVYEQSRDGDRWRARIGPQGPVFDPDWSRVELDRRRWLRWMALILASGGLAFAVPALLRRRDGA